MIGLKKWGEAEMGRHKWPNSSGHPDVERSSSGFVSPQPFEECTRWSGCDQSGPAERVNVLAEEALHVNPDTAALVGRRPEGWAGRKDTKSPPPPGGG